MQFSNHRRFSDLFKWVQFYSEAMGVTPRHMMFETGLNVGGIAYAWRTNNTALSFFSLQSKDITDLSFFLPGHAVLCLYLAWLRIILFRMKMQFRSFGSHFAFMSPHGRCCFSAWFGFDFSFYMQNNSIISCKYIVQLRIPEVSSFECCSTCWKYKLIYSPWKWQLNCSSKRWSTFNIRRGSFLKAAGVCWNVAAKT
jgi:hypothetical protein